MGWQESAPTTGRPAPRDLPSSTVKAYALYGRYRIALSWPALGMRQFMHPHAPDLIHETLARVAGAAAR